MYKYLTVCERLFREDIGAYSSYGIISVREEDARIVRKISDVSTERDFVMSLAESFTEINLEPQRLLEAVRLAIDN